MVGQLAARSTDGFDPLVLVRPAGTGLPAGAAGAVVPVGRARGVLVGVAGTGVSVGSAGASAHPATSSKTIR